MLRSIKTIEDKGGDLVLTLTEGNADLPLLLSDYHLIIQPNGGFDDPDAAIGTGPYKLTSFEAGVRATFEKNADDWRDRPRLSSTASKSSCMNDATARIAALSSGQVHFINRVDPKTVKLSEARADRRDPLDRRQGLLLFIMHCDTAPFDNNDLRLALKYAMDREAMVDQHPRRLRQGRQRLSRSTRPMRCPRGYRAARLRSRQGGLPLQEVRP